MVFAETESGFEKEGVDKFCKVFNMPFICHLTPGTIMLCNMRKAEISPGKHS